MSRGRDLVEASELMTHGEQQALAPQGGVLIVNADDWGRDRENTDRILECVSCKAVSSVSAMVFMEDSERAAGIAREHEVDAGLHLNFTTPFSAPGASSRLNEHQQKLSRYLGQHRFAKVVFHPGLTASFEYVIAAQLDEYRRLYGADPERLDGHHHMHLCANVLLGGLLPCGTRVRRSFSFRPGEKSRANRLYRRLVDRVLARRHRLVDFFFALPPLAPPERLQRIFSLARHFAVEVETHPVVPEEHRFLTGGGIFQVAADLQIARRYGPPQAGSGARSTGLSSFKGRLSCSLPYAFAFGTTVYQLSDYL